MNGLPTKESALTAGATLLATETGQAATRGKITAGEVVQRIKDNIGIPWDYSTHRDNFKTGGPDTPVMGIATTFGGNLRVLQLAQKMGLNMVIVHEPTFYSDQDVVLGRPKAANAIGAGLKEDPLYKFKRAFIDRNNMVIWRIHDHWHAHHPDGISTGWIKHIGWGKYEVNGSLRLYKLPPTTLGELAKFVAATLPTHSVRVMGDPNLPVTVVGKGGHDLLGQMENISNADCLLVSEAREYDSFEYVRDIIALNPKRGAIFISHEAGEDWGMNEFAQFLTPFITEVPIKYIPTTDEFWTV